MKPRILILENSIQISGALKSIQLAASGLQAKFDFVFVIPSGATDVERWIRKNGFHSVYQIPMIELSRRPLSLIAYLPMLCVNAIRLRKIIRKEKISLIHNNDIYNMLPVVLRAFLSEVPYLCHVRFLPGKFPGLLYRMWVNNHLKFALSIVVVSRHLENLLPVNKKIKMIYDPLPEESDADFTNAHSSSVRTILYPSNIIPGKGLDLAIHTFSKIHSEFPEWRLVFIGSDAGSSRNRKFKKMLIDEVDKLNMNDKVIWKEFSDSLGGEYKSADLVWNFSESESFSRTCLEASYYGCPVIATQSGGPQEIIDDKVTGMLVPVNDIDAMTEASRYLMSRPEVRSIMGREGYSRIRQKFQRKFTIEKLEEVYLEACS